MRQCLKSMALTGLRLKDYEKSRGCAAFLLISEIFVLHVHKEGDIIFLVPYLNRYGGLAQLGERNAGSVEVRGSSPLFSTY